MRATLQGTSNRRRDLGLVVLVVTALIAGLVGWQAWRARAPFGSAESAARLYLAVGRNGSDSSTASATSRREAG